MLAIVITLGIQLSIAAHSYCVASGGFPTLDDYAIWRCIVPVEPGADTKRAKVSKEFLLERISLAEPNHVERIRAIQVSNPTLKTVCVWQNLGRLATLDPGRRRAIEGYLEPTSKHRDPAKWACGFLGVSPDDEYLFTYAYTPYLGGQCFYFTEYQLTRVASGDVVGAARLSPSAFHADFVGFVSDAPYLGYLLEAAPKGCSQILGIRTDGQFERISGSACYAASAAPDGDRVAMCTPEGGAGLGIEVRSADMNRIVWRRLSRERRHIECGTHEILWSRDGATSVRTAAWKAR